MFAGEDDDKNIATVSEKLLKTSTYNVLDPCKVEESNSL